MFIDVYTKLNINRDIFAAIDMPARRVRPDVVRVTCPDAEYLPVALDAVGYVFGRNVRVAIDRNAPQLLSALTAPEKMTRKARARHKKASSRPPRPETCVTETHGDGFVILKEMSVPTPATVKYDNRSTGANVNDMFIQEMFLITWRYTFERIPNYDALREAYAKNPDSIDLKWAVDNFNKLFAR